MMLALDGSLTSERERDLLLHLGACKSCRASWNALEESTTWLPEIHLMAPVPEDLWARVRDALPAGQAAGVPGRRPAGTAADRQPVGSIEPWLAGTLVAAGLLFGSGITLLGVAEGLRLLGKAAGWAMSGLDGVERLLSSLVGPGWSRLGEGFLFLSAGLLLLLLCIRATRHARPSCFLGWMEPAESVRLREGRPGGG